MKASAVGVGGAAEARSGPTVAVAAHSEASAPLCSPHQASLSVTERRRLCYKAGPWRICAGGEESL